MITGELKSKIDKIWNDFWTGGISNPLTVIEQFTYLIFLRQLDARQTKAEQSANLLGIPLENEIYAPKYNTFRWSHFKQLEAQEMFNIFTRPNKDLNDLTAFDFMKNIGKKGGVFSQYMKGAIFMIQSPKLLDKVVQQIDTIDLDNRDTKGDLYEYMLSKIAESGKNGQFRTPRHIIRMMVHIMQPQQEDTICDPSSGTAGFLVAAGQYIYDQHQDWFLNDQFRKHFHNQMFNGVEFDPTMLRIGAMNMQLHGLDNPNLIGKDALSESNGDINEQFSLILANPPFKGSLDYDEVESSLLKVTKTKKTELLFLALMLRMLKTGGRAAVIVPDGVLFGSSNAHKSIRKELVENQQLQAVISMPSGVFKPYAGVSTAILIFTKTNSGGTENVWFYDMKADGLSLDDKRSLLIDEDAFEQCFTQPKNMAAKVKDKCDIPQILLDAKQLLNVNSSDFEKDEQNSIENNYQNRTQQSFLVPKQEIIDNDWDLSINRYKEIVYEEIAYEAPNELLQQIKELDAQRNKTMLNLEKMME
ncbi:N-6 DNA methylase [Tenacibaculum soleae]|uniref:site-specific DNA-methyltransferase (adenine-specific) n=1 Tax=Tenacibaculum soleae TaxID=447689 RepID=A0A1B9Y236_9FLAO|nr:class I SAM-dependent DNA methyltransferase [Tenacibaculum soleae]OCK43878.1 N-6 DNA methylase [Tenacibaculum soleae]